MLHCGGYLIVVRRRRNTEEEVKERGGKRRKSLHIYLNCYGYLSCEIKWQRKIRLQESVCIGMNELRP